MNTKIAIKTVTGSFCIAWALWGCILVANQFGYLKYGTPLSMVLFLLGGNAPAIAAFMVLLKNKVMPAKQLIKTVFAVKQHVLMYLIVIGFVVIYFGTGMLTGILEYKSPIYLSLVTFPIMIIGGGLEEVGWRFVLNPALERKLPFAFANSITAVIWSVWHLPLFFIEGTSQNAMNFGIFLFVTFGLSFAYAAIYRFSKSVWLCVFIHALNNSLYGSFLLKIDRFDVAAMPAVITAVALIIVSILAVIITEKFKKTIPQ